MDDRKPSQPVPPKYRRLEWSLAGLIGFAGGFSNMAARIRNEFNEKLLHFISNTDSIALRREKDNKENLIKALENPSEKSAKMIVEEQIDELKKSIENLSHSEEKFRRQDWSVDGTEHTLVDVSMKRMERELTAKKELLEDIKTLSPEAMKQKLGRQVKAIEARSHIKREYDMHPVALDKNFEQRIEHHFNPDISAKQATKEFFKQGSERKGEWNKKLGEFGKKFLGVESEGLNGYFRGTVQKYKYMGKNTWLSLAKDVAIATTIGVAAPIMFFNSLNMHNKLNQVLSNTDQVER